LYIESVNLGFDHIGTSLLQHLGIKYSADGESSEIEQLLCQYNNFMDDMNFNYAGGIDAHFSVDHLVPNQSTYLYKSDDGFGRMFAMANDNYRAISSSVVFGAIKNADSLNTKPYFMAEMINFLLGVTTITSVSELVVNEPVSVVNYPNPFTEVTNISFTLQESSKVQLDIFNQMGQLIYTIADENMTAGNHVKSWNATNRSGPRVNNGIYFYKLSIGSQINSGKILLMD
jgi:hypothetical protein